MLPEASVFPPSKISGRSYSQELESAAVARGAKSWRPAPSVNASVHADVSELQLHLFNLDISLV